MRYEYTFLLFCTETAQWYFSNLQGVTGIITCKLRKCPDAMKIVTGQGGPKFLALTNNDVKSQDVSAVICKLNLQIET